MCAWRAVSTLFDLGEVGRVHEDGDRTFSTILPLASDSAATFFHSGSLRKSAQFLSACSRLSWAMM